MTDLSERRLDPTPVLRLSRRPLSEVSASVVLRQLFSAGLSIGSCLRLTDEASGARLTRIIDELDAIGAEVRRSVTGYDGGLGTCDGGGDADLGPLVAEMARTVGLLTDHIDILCRPGVADRLPDIHLVGAVQNLQQALMYLDAADRSNGPVRTG